MQFNRFLVRPLRQHLALELDPLGLRSKHWHLFDETALLNKIYQIHFRCNLGWFRF